MNKCKEQFELHIRSLGGDYNLFMVDDVYIDVESQIEWRTWQKAWQAALASQQPADDGWIEWKGGACPVPPETLVDCIRADGDQFAEYPASSVYWYDTGCGDSIIAYRVVKL